jgi:hypothetical protein
VALGSGAPGVPPPSPERPAGARPPLSEGLPPRGTSRPWARPASVVGIPQGESLPLGGDPDRIGPRRGLRGTVQGDLHAGGSRSASRRRSGWSRCAIRWEGGPVRVLVESEGLWRGSPPRGRPARTFGCPPRRSGQLSGLLPGGIRPDDGPPLGLGTRHGEAGGWAGLRGTRTRCARRPGATRVPLTGREPLDPGDR